MSLRTSLLATAQPRFVAACIFITGSKVSLGTVEDVADRVVSSEQAALTDLGFVVGDPVTDLKLHHLAFSIRQVKLKRAIERVRRLLVIIKDKVAADGGYPIR